MSGLGFEDSIQDVVLSDVHVSTKFTPIKEGAHSTDHGKKSEIL